MNDIKNYIAELPVPVLITACMILSGLVGFIDYITGEYGLTVIYILPIYVSAKLLGRRGSIGVTVVCILELTGLALLFRKEYESFFDVVFWNSLLQSVELGITGYLIAQFTSKLCRPPQK
jgi:hypothetical protein